MTTTNENEYRCIPEHPEIEISMDGKVRYIGKTYLIKPYYVEPLNVYRVCYYVGYNPRFVVLPYLVARCFVANPNGYRYVNHIDGNHSNYHATNLEWVKTNRKNLKTPEELKVSRRVRDAKYREEHREYILERQQNWRERNKDIVSLKAREYWENNKERFLQRYNCEVCGCSHLLKHKERHEQSKKHINALANQNDK